MSGVDTSQEVAAAVAIAESYVGKIPYVWARPLRATVRKLTAADCSGLAMFVYWHAFGKKLIHSAAVQYTQLRHRPFSEVEPGDLVFFRAGGVIYHVGIYVGASTIVEAADPQIGVRTRKIDASTPDLVMKVGAHPGAALGNPTSSSGHSITLGGVLKDVGEAASPLAYLAGHSAGDAVNSGLSGWESFVVKAGFALAGVGLVVLGTYVAAQPATDG